VGGGNNDFTLQQVATMEVRISNWEFGIWEWPTDDDSKKMHGL
jgi:hypothetical protein